MEKLEKSLKEKAKKGLTAVALAGTLAFGNSCAFNTHTKKENLWFTAATAAHVGDIGITRYGISRGFLETNPLYGKDAKIERLLAVKTAYLGMIYGLGESFPEKRGLFNKIATITGAVPFLWNVLNIITYSSNKE